MEVKKKSFLPLLFTNYLGVMNDNFLKTLASFICVLWVGKNYESLVVTSASAALVIPYLLFSPLAGRWAKVFSKRKIVIWAKFAEMFIMLVATAGFLSRSTGVVLFSILLMGLQSALFSPAKYGLIRDIGGIEGLSYGSGAMEMFAFVGILSGTLLASFLSESVGMPVLCLLLFLLALGGWLSSLTIKAREGEPLKKSEETLNPVKFAGNMFVKAKSINGLNLVVWGLATFWLIGSMIQMILIVYCRNELGMTDFQTGLVMSAAAVGIGTGCLMAGILSGKRVELGLVPIGGVATAILFVTVYFIQSAGMWFAVLIFLAAFCSGFFKVPLDAWIQEHVKGRALGDMLAYSNMVTFLFMLFASVFFWLIDRFWETRVMFMFLGLLILVATGVLFFGIGEVRERLYRNEGARFRMVKRLAVFYGKALGLRYKVRLEGTEVLEGAGPMLILPNHQATVDPQLLFAYLCKYTTAAPLVSDNYTRIGILKPLFSLMGVVPVPDLERGRRGVEVVAGLHEVVLNALREQKNILIYPAGQLADQGYERIRNKQTAWQVCRQLPEGTRIIGVRIRGLWGSMWSRAWNGKSPDFLSTYLKGLFYVLANLLFFLPRRQVSISFFEITEEAEARAGEGRQAFNHYLEMFYNAPGEEAVLFLKHFFYFPASRRKLPVRG